MRHFVQKILVFGRSNEGPNSVEYAILLALMLSVSMTATQTLGCNTAIIFARVSLAIRAAR
jgi:Flp pilus assembly pilin Flp